MSERTVHIGVGLIHLIPVLRRLGVGEYRMKRSNIKYGWFLTEDEFRAVLTEWDRERDERAEQRRKRQRHLSYATRPPPKSERQRAIAAWRNEWADPFSVRRTPEECWQFACSYVWPDRKAPPIPTEQLPPRPSREAVVAHAAGTRIDVEGDHETDGERESRANREAVAALRTPSRGWGAGRTK